MKRRRAFDRRQKEQQQKELERFKTKRMREIKPVLPDKLSGIPIWPYRWLRGGADRQDANEVTIEQSLLNLEESIAPMINKAIQNAQFHGIHLRQGVKNLANGDCAFETVLDSINTQTCFAETFPGTPAYWRNIWMSEIETIAYQGWNGGLTLEEWKHGFDILKQSGTYELTLGDLVPPGIAHCTKKNLLIFNTSPQAHSPVYVISAATFGGSANSDIPVCLAYDQAHYESLVPCSDSDIEKAVILSKQVLSGEYKLKMKDFNMFECKANNYQCKSSNYDSDFPPLAPKQEGLIKMKTNPKTNCKSEEKNMKIVF